ncbi:hypothetical protein JK164_13465 [Gluconobacter kondonii]|uniref:hypothetical protein n=1 Tax=Gluconobacter kondonii TaxID=941463 RepID=UPI001B8C8B9F|nr:hypothetical protein [Gluconobacter kondonii]MBS1066921.1 hypothetical protein [Gluconobacter kondonii]
MRILPIFSLSLAFAMSVGSAIADDNKIIDNKSPVVSTNENLLTVDHPGFEGTKKYTVKTVGGFCASVEEHWEKNSIVNGHQTFVKVINTLAPYKCSSNS